MIKSALQTKRMIGQELAARTKRFGEAWGPLVRSTEPIKLPICSDSFTHAFKRIFFSCYGNSNRQTSLRP